MLTMNFKFASHFLIGAFLSLGLAGCRSTAPERQLQRFTFQQPHMGTIFTITLYATNEAAAAGASNAAFEKVAALEKIMSDYDPDSELMRLCSASFGKPVPVSDELFDVLQKSQRISELSDGAFDVTVGPLVRQWRRARRTQTLPTPEQLAQSRQAVGWHKLTLDTRNKTVTLTVPNMQLDLGGIAKGYAADKALESLRQNSITRALVAASGDIAIGDPPPGARGWTVKIGDPTLKKLTLANAAISTSGDSEQFVEIAGRRYSHILDPLTGLGLTAQAQVSIISKHATDTDAFATAASVLGVKQGSLLIESQPDMAGIFLLKLGEQTELMLTRRMDFYSRR